MRALQRMSPWAVIALLAACHGAGGGATAPRPVDARVYRRASSAATLPAHVPVVRVNAAPAAAPGALVGLVRVGEGAGVVYVATLTRAAQPGHYTARVVTAGAGVKVPPAVKVASVTLGGKVKGQLGEARGTGVENDPLTVDVSVAPTAPLPSAATVEVEEGGREVAIPLAQVGPKGACAQDAECGAGGRCLLGVCAPPAGR